MSSRSRHSSAPPVPVRTTSLSSSSRTSLTSSRTSLTPSPPTPPPLSSLPYTPVTGMKRKAAQRRPPDDAAYMSALLLRQGEALTRMRDKCGQQEEDVVALRSSVRDKELRLYRQLLGSACVSGQAAVTSLVDLNDENRVLKSEITALISEIWSYGYDGPLGYFADDQKPDAGAKEEYGVAAEAAPPPPVKPRGQKSEPKFGMIYGRVPPSPGLSLPPSAGLLPPNRLPGRTVSESGKPPARPPKPESYKRTNSQRP